MTEKTLPIVEDFQLLLELNPKGESAAFVPVRWCLSPEARTALIDRDASDAYMLLIVAGSYGSEEDPAWRITDRKLIKLTAEMAYVRFNRPGDNRIFGLIIWPGSDRAAKMRERVFGVYDPIDSWNGQINQHFLEPGYSRTGTGRLGYIAQRDVVVPAEMFAPEPAPWKKTVVRKFFRNRENDQCHWRKHLPASMVMLPFYIVFTMVVRIVYSLVAGVLMGHRRIRWSSLWHPFRDDTGDIWSRVKPFVCWWSSDKDGNTRPIYWIILQPVTYSILPLILWVAADGISINGKPWLGWSLIHCFVVVVIGHVILILMVCLIAVLSFVITKLFGLLPKEDAEKSEESARKHQDAFEAGLDAMVCSNSNKGLTLNDLPENKRTLVLRFNGVKKGICLPFAK
jgi:hypothetical protein